MLGNLLKWGRRKEDKRIALTVAFAGSVFILTFMSQAVLGIMEPGVVHNWIVKLSGMALR